MPAFTPHRSPDREPEHSRALRLFLRDRHLACPGCGYDLCGLATDRCPECGHAPRLTVEGVTRGLSPVLQWLREIGRYGAAFNIGVAALVIAIVIPTFLTGLSLLPLPRLSRLPAEVLVVSAIILAIGAGLPLGLWWRTRKRLTRAGATERWVGAVACCIAAGLSLVIQLLFVLY